jgi:hypothetical protein
MSERFPTLRQSRLAVFDSCALRAFFEEKYRRDWSGHPQGRGQVMHRVFARALRTMHEQQEPSIPTDAMLELLFDELRMAGGELLNVPFKEIKDMRWVAVKFANDTKFDIPNLVDIEHRLAAPIVYDRDGERVERVLTGQLDAMFVAGENDEEAVVLDWKDTWDLPGPADVTFEGYFQQRFYAFLVLKHYRAIERVTLREHYVRFSEFREATVHRGELEYVEAELSALAQRFDRAFERSEFPPSPGRHCQLCPMPADCPIFPDVRVEGMITNEETARRVAGEAKVARAALNQREKALKAWASVHGPVPLNSTPGREQVWGFRQRKRVSRPTREELEKQLYLHGKRMDLDKLYKESVGTRFEPHRPDGPDDTADDVALFDALQRSVDQQASERPRAPETGSEEAA